MCSTFPLNSAQALARVVAQFQKMEGDMRASVTPDTDREALQAMLKEASHASIDPDTSGVAKVLQEHIRKANACMFWCFEVEFHK